MSISSDGLTPILKNPWLVHGARARGAARAESSLRVVRAASDDHDLPQVGFILLEGHLGHIFNLPGGLKTFFF